MNKTLKHVLFTFDYELFLGSKSGTVENCLIKPTNKILSILEPFNAKAIFFIDTTYLIRLKEVKEKFPAANNDWLKIVEQVKIIFRGGHDIFPHLHPHWLDAVYLSDTNEWDLSDLSRYRFNNINSTVREFLWHSSIAILEEIIRPSSAVYAFDGYRAGGWCIQPFTDFRPYFEKYGVRYEFSVNPGYKQLTTAHQFDFLAAPRKAVYRFEEDILKEDQYGRYTEFTISSIKRISGIYSLANKILFKSIFRKGTISYGDGYTVQAIAIDKDADYWHLNTNTEMISIEHLTIAKLPAYRKFLRENNYMQFLSHPKLLHEHHLSCLMLFLKTIFEKHAVNTDFRKISL